MFDTLYKVRPSDRSGFGSAWCFAHPSFGHGGDELVAVYHPRLASPRGVKVEVLVAAYPARFYTLRAPGLEVVTGSGDQMKAAMQKVAIGLSEGYLKPSEVEIFLADLVAEEMVTVHLS